MSDSTWGVVAGVGGESATEGSYGERPLSFRLPAATRLGPVCLQVTDLERSVAFYRDVLGFQVIAYEEGRARLGAGGDERVLVGLEERRVGTAVQRRPRLGLFHFAILVPDRGTLGRFARHMADSGIQPGAGDHLVSEALYLQDPDGLGIEVYADRPRSEWRRVGRELSIGTEPLDIASLLMAARGEPWTGLPTGTVVGHVHLRVGDLRQAAAFFSDALGFDLMTWSYPGALFLGAGGYHHHLGTNVWDRGAQQAAADEPRLLEWTIEVPDVASVEAAAHSLAEGGYPVTRGQEEIVTCDPWGTAIRIRTARD
jgi:catechol 2,3-dioxygenase